MATLQQQNQARGFVTSPLSPLPMPAARPVARRAKTTKAPYSILSERLAAAEGRAQAAEDAKPDGVAGLLGKGLGIVLNNPVVRTVTRPLDVLDVPRRAVWSTINEVADAFNGGDVSFSDWYDQTNPLHVITQHGDTSFGAGDVIGSTGNKWVDRGIGLLGDVALDPMTYVAGVGFVPEAGTISTRLGRMTRLAEGTEALAKVGGLTDEIIEGAKRVANSGNWGQADPLLREAAQVSDTAGVHLKIPFTKATTGPLPGTRRAGGALADAIGAVKGKINASDWGRARAVQTAPNEFVNTMPRMLSGKASNGDFMKALESVPFVNAQREAQNTVKALAVTDVKKATRQIKEWLSKGNTIEDLIRNTEDLNAAPTPLNWLTDRIIEHAAAEGVELPKIEGIGYFPHVLGKEFKELLNAGGEDAERFLQQTDIISKELTADAGFLGERKLRPQPGRPLTITLPNGRSTTIVEGTVEEINAKMKQLFPQLKGTALETDPRTVMERYIEAMSTNIGNRAAENDAIKRGSQYFGVLPGGQVDEVGGLGPAGPGLVEGPVIPAGGPVVTPRGVDPFADNPYLRGVKDDELSVIANEQAAAQTSREITEQEIKADALRRQAATKISDTARQVTKGLDEGIEAVDQRLAGDVAPLQARQADLNTTRADLDLADLPAQDRLDEVNEELARIPGDKAATGAEIIGNQQAMRKLGADTQQTVEGLKEFLQQLNSRISGLRSAATGKTRRETAAWRATHEGNVASARADLERLKEEAAGLREWSSQSQDRLNYQIVEDEISKFYDDIRQAEANLDAVSGAKRADLRAARGRPDDATIQEARRHLKENPNVQRYDDAVAIRDAAKAGEKVDPQKLADARKYLRTKAAKRVPENRKLLEGLDEADQAIARGVASDPEVRAAQRAASNADLSTKRKPAMHYEIPGVGGKPGLYVDEQEIKRLFPEAGIDPREVKLSDYLQRLRRSYGQENTVSRGVRLKDAVRGQEEAIKQINRNLEELFRETGAKAIEARNQAEYMWKTFPEEMRKQQVQEQIISIPAAAQVQMEALDAINTNLRVDYKTLLVNQKARQAERDAIEAGMATRDAARTDINSVDAALGAQVDSLVSDAATETQHLQNVRGVPGKRSIDPAAEIAADPAALRPTKKSLKGFDLQTDPATLQPMNQVVNDIHTMARFDPNMTSQTLGATESLLMQHRQMLRNVSGEDLTTHQLEGILREANSGRLVDVVAGQMRDTWTMLPGRGDMVIDTELNRWLTNLLNVKKEPGLFGQTLTAFTNFFKTYATLTPGFHIRNAMSAVFMNTVDGVPLRTQMEGLSLWREFTKAEDPALWLRHQPEDVQKAFRATFASGAGGRFLESGVAEATATGRTKFKEGIYRNRATDISQRAGEKVEGSVRLGMALDTTRSGGSVASAYDRLARIHFDYAAVSEMDEKAKQLVPFWTFTSRNLPMQISEMWKKPRVYSIYNNFVRNFSVDPAEFTPEYFESVGAWNTGEEVGGMPLYAAPDLPHLRVQEDLDRYAKALSGENPGQALSDINPFFTALPEYIFGQDMYTGKQYKDTDWTKASGLADTAMLPILALAGQTKRGANGDIYIQDKGMNSMRSLIPMLDRTIRLAPDTSGSSGDSSRQLESWARTMLAAPVRTLSPQQQQSTRRSQYYDKLDAAAMQRVLAGGQA